MPRRKATSDVGGAMRRQITHGMAGDVPVVAGVESAEEYRAHVEAIVAEWAPQGAMEREYAGRIASILWRLRRVARYEVETIAVARERVDFDFARQRIWDERPASVEEANQRAETARRIVAMLESITKLPSETPLPSADVEQFLAELAAHAGMDPDALMEGISDLGADDDDASDDDGDGLDDAPDAGADWTAGGLTAALRAIAARDPSAFEDGLHAFVGHARELAAGAEREVVNTRAEIDRMQRERLLPGAHALELIVRYETALNRMLYQAINQLEAAQARRAGAPVALPLRLQHYGGRNG